MTSILYDAPGPQARQRTLIGSIIGGVFVLAVIGLAINQLATNDIFQANRWDIYYDPPKNQVASDVWKSLLVDGLGATLRAAVVAAPMALALGVALAVWRMAETRWIRLPAVSIIELFRGLPVALMMLFGVLALSLNFFQAVVFGLVVYNMAIFAEIFRAGIVSLPKGQSEAAYAIGLSKAQTLFTVLMPQAVRRMLPAIISQLVVLLKDSSLGFIIGYAELLRRVRLNRDFFGDEYMFALFFVGAAIYIAINVTLSRTAVWLERRGTKKAAGGVVPARIDDLATGLNT